MTGSWRIEPVSTGPDLLAELHRDCFEHPWNAEAFASFLRTPGTIATLASGAEADAVPAGFALFRLIGGEAEVITLGVRTPCRGRGVGAALLDDLAARAGAAGASAMVLEVAVDNAAAIALYEAAGFKVKGRRRRYYRRTDGNVDAIIMRRAL